MISVAPPLSAAGVMGVGAVRDVYVSEVENRVLTTRLVMLEGARIAVTLPVSHPTTGILLKTLVGQLSE